MTVDTNTVNETRKGGAPGGANLCSSLSYMAHFRVVLAVLADVANTFANTSTSAPYELQDLVGAKTLAGARMAAMFKTVREGASPPTAAC
eukprot:1253813-Prymnesium_polylepis.1